MNQFTNAWKQFFTHLFKLNGKSTRMAYNCVMIPLLLVIGLLQGVADISISKGHVKFGFYLAMVAMVVILLMMITSFCLVARRNQDVGISKWYVVLMFIPQLGYLYLVIMMCLKSNLQLHFHLFPHYHKYLN